MRRSRSTGGHRPRCAGPATPSWMPSTYSISERSRSTRAASTRPSRPSSPCSRTWRAAGYRAGAADAKGKLARVRAAQGRYDEALDLFESVIEEMVAIGSRGDALEATARMAECLLLSGDSAEALAVSDRCLDLAQNLGGVPPQIPLIHRVRGAALANSGDVGAAIEALSQSLIAARSRGAEYESALTLRVFAECEPKLRQSSEETMRKLMVLVDPRARVADRSAADNAA